MKVTPTAIPDVLILEPKVFHDERGFFFESFNQRAFQEATGLDVTFVQDNQSHSKKGVLRGLHYQLPPHAQGKLVHVVSGEVFDVAVDIRPGSSTFGQWVGDVLNSENHRVRWIPPGFAHGFLTLSESADFLYKTTGHYAPALEQCIAWNDPEIGIVWPEGLLPYLSTKDLAGLPLRKASLLA